jgi:hypothetical protein
MSVFTLRGGIVAALFLFISPGAPTMETAAPASVVNNTGFSYAPELATKLGLPADKARPLEAPLLGAALEVKAGIAGPVCLLHVLYDASIDIRLPDAVEMHALGSNADSLPAGFLAKPDKSIRQFFATQVGALSNRAIFRNGYGQLTEGIAVHEDKRASYTSMPLTGYHREFVPGVGWLAMTVNCELAAHAEYTNASLFVERNDSPSDMIFNAFIDPAKMIEFRVPAELMKGMRNAMRAASDENSFRLPQGGEGRFSTF